MNYVWEVMLKAIDQGIPEQNIRFQVGKDYSAYMELSGEYLNQEKIEHNAVIELNPYFRFFDIFKDLFHPDLILYPKLRENLSNLILHQLAQNDRFSGMTKEEYYKKLLYHDLDREVFGQNARKAISLFYKEEQAIILSGILRQYETGSSLDLFTDMMESLIPNNIVYHSNENPYEILIYIGQKREKRLTEKVDFLIYTFVEIPYCTDIYYEYHFGILGMEETMVLDEITMC